MRKMILSPLFAPIVAFLVMVLLGLAATYYRSKGIDTFFEDGYFCDIVTYSLYGILLVCLLFFYKDFKGKFLTWIILLFLNVAAIFHETFHELSSKIYHKFFYLSTGNFSIDRIF